MSFITKTEKALNKAFATAKKENIDGAISKSYSDLIASLSQYKNLAIDENKTQLKTALTNEIIKRYFYKEGLYSYYISNNPEIIKAKEVLLNNDQYRSILGY